jgi:hypothetical protein
MNADLLRRAAAAAIGGLIVFAALPSAKAQWLPPWRPIVVRAGDIADRLEAQGYQLIAPLQRRPGVYLADVRAGPAGYQRLVIDDRSGEILERFMAPPRRFAPQFAARNDAFAAPPPWGDYQPPPGPPPVPGGLDAGPAARSAYGGPSNLHIPDAVSPYGSQQKPIGTKPKPQPVPTARKSPSPMVAPPLPPPAPREATKPEEAPPATKPEPKVESPPGESENASSAPSAPLAPEARPEAAQTAPGSEAQAQPAGSAPDPAASPAAPPPSDKSKVSIVPGALFE